MKRIVSVALSLIIMVTSTLCAQSLGALSTSMAGTMLSGKDLQALAQLRSGGETEFSDPDSSSESSEISSEPSSSSEMSSSQPSSSSKASSKPSSSSSKPTSSSSKPVSSSSSAPSSTPTPSSSSSTPQQGDVYRTAVMGANVATAEQMATYLLRNNYNPKINGTVWDLVTNFLSEGSAEGVRGDIAFCQSLHETGWFAYGGNVQPYQNNYCGLGSTANGVTGSVFPSPQIGVRAQIQHLKAYASTLGLVNSVVDPRFSYVTRGIAPLWTDLSGRWAVPGYSTTAYGSLDAAKADHADYGSRILTKYISLISVTPDANLVQRAKSVSFSWPAP